MAFLKSHGYDGIFQKKKDDFNKDGCALFWKTSKCEKLDHQSISLGNQVAIVAKFLIKSENPENSRKICIAVTHLKAKEGFEDKRVKQGAEILKTIKEEFLGKEDLPLIVSGDFNDVPSSYVYKLFRDGKAADSKNVEYTQPFHLQSAYTHYDETGVEPYSTYKKRDKVVIRSIDYIWYSHENLAVTQLLEIPKPEAFVNHLPCDTYPSDHLAINATFHFLK